MTATPAEVPRASWGGESIGPFCGGGSPTTVRDSIDANRVSNLGHDRTQLTTVTTPVKEAIAEGSLTVLADRGFFKSDEILTIEQAGIVPLLPEPQSSNNKAQGLYAWRCHRWSSGSGGRPDAALAALVSPAKFSS
jgi:hypothetical protein